MEGLHRASGIILRMEAMGRDGMGVWSGVGWDEMG